MAPVQVATGTTASLAAFTASFGSTTTSNNMIEVTIRMRLGGTTGTTFSVTDNKSNSYNPVASVGLASTFDAGCLKFYAKGITGGSGHVVTITPTGGSLNDEIDAIAVEYQGLDPTNPLDQTATGSNTSTAPSAGPTSTLAQSNELVTCGNGTLHTGDTYTVGGSFTLNTTINGAVGDEWMTVASTAGVTGTWTVTSDTWYCVTATYKGVNYTIDQDAYQLRNDDGSESAATNAAGANSTVNFWPPLLNLRLRFQVNFTNDPGSLQFRLERKVVGPAVAAWVAVEATTPDVFLSDSANISAGGTQATTALMAAPSGKTTANFFAGQIDDDTSPMPGINPTNNSYTELEWSVQFGTSTVGNSYQFRVTVNGAPFDTYSQVGPTVLVANNCPEFLLRA